MKAAAVADLAGGLFEKIVDVLAGLRLQSGFRFDPVGNLNRGFQAHVRVEFPSAAEVGLDQDEFVGGDLSSILAVEAELASLAVFHEGRTSSVGFSCTTTVPATKSPSRRLCWLHIMQTRPTP